MSTRKRNEFLDGDDSEDEGENGYDSEAAEESRGAVISHATKRRKVDDDSEISFHELDDALLQDDGEDLSDDGEDQSDDGKVFSKAQLTSPIDAPSHSVGRIEDEERSQEDDVPKSIGKEKKSSAVKQAERAQKAVRKSGVVYISRVPPFMKPHTLRHFLEPHASKGLGKIFLTPEEHTTYLKRIKNGGNKKRSFTDGWVEFTSKTEAKLAAEILNGNIIGGKKGNFYHDDLWNMKYLKGFKWNHLTEQIANENAERAARLREEIRKTRQENKTFVEDIEKAKMLDGMEKKRKAKIANINESQITTAATTLSRPGREFKQRKVQTKTRNNEAPATSKELSSVLSKIF